MRLLDRAIRRWSRCLLGWPRGSPVPAVHLESGRPDAQRLITKSAVVPLRAHHFHAHRRLSSASRWPRVLVSLLATCSDLCTSLEIVTPSSFGVGPGCSVQQVREWITQCVAPPLDRLCDRLLVAIEPSLPFPGCRSARHLGCDPSCVLCGAATRDLFHCLTLSSQICGCNGACVPSLLTAPLFGSSTRGSSTLNLT